MDFSQIQLIYRAEGNANLVLVVPQHKKVLRLPKATVDSLKSTVALMDINTSVSRRDFLDLFVSHLADEQMLDPKDHVAYMELMTHLLGEEYAYHPDIVSISSTERDTLNRFSMSYRPVERLDKEFCGQFGLLIPDATQLPDKIALKGASGDTYSIEIKPKQGWMLQDSQLPDLFDLRGVEKCRYCSMQYLKLTNRKISKLSSFCPMDIFSGDVTRMTKALKALIAAPQNNLRIFKNGIFVYGEGKADNLKSFENVFLEGNHSTIYDIMIRCLLKNYCESSHSHPDLHSDVVNRKLSAGCILRRLLELQLLAKKNLISMADSTARPEKTYYFLRELLNKKIFSIEDLTPKEQYMIGATAMDCSIMVTFQEVEKAFIGSLKHCPNLVTIGPKAYLTKVTAVDLDPKSDNHFYKFVSQTNEAYKITLNYLKS